jgi:hypothetical protein
MKNIKSALYLLLFVIIISACTKAGTGGNNTLYAYPFHHAKPIPNATIYIKYGAKTFPGTDVSAYDDNKVAMVYAGENPHAIFTGLNKGYYFLYGVGFDSALGLPVTGGIPMQITKKSGETDIDVPITEQ